jgi:ubiquinone/menaquinone biosynthesis C-methylase UbiE
MSILKTFYLGFKRLQSKENYRKLQEHVADETIKELRKKGVLLEDLRMLELGSGRGGYSKVFQTNVKEFIASDIEKDEYFNQNNITFTKVDVNQKFPFENEQFDFIQCASVIEHVSDPFNLLNESRRILKKNGRMLLSFPPFYSIFLIGGHQFKPFHFFGEKTAVFLTNFVHRKNYKNYAHCYGDFGLHPLTIKSVQRMICESGFRIINTYTRMSWINTTLLPGFLKDLSTWHVCYLITPNNKE